MSRTAVWAPFAARVDVACAGQRYAMRSGGGGWWDADVPALRPGADYAFHLDGGPPLPDPRSAHQPHGVHGASRWVDHAAHAWECPATEHPLTRASAIYELHAGTFTPAGTFDAAREKLGHLRELGITHVEVMPVNAFSGQRGWGYDGVGLYAVQDSYGGPAGFKRFIDACHVAGLGVILDVVYNHLGPEGNYLDRFGPYFTEKYRTPWGKAVNFDEAGSDGVRRFVTDNAVAWLRDYRIDGLRIDGIHAIFDMSAVHILEELARCVDRFGRESGRAVFLIGESDLNNPVVIAPWSAGGYGLDAQWADDIHHALHVVLTGEQSGYYGDFNGLPDLAKAMRQAFVYDGRYSPCRQRRHGRPPTGLDGDRFVAFLQNHDQVGNRAAGERIGQLVNPRRVKIGAALLLTAPFVPMLFQGEEWAASTPFQYFTDHGDPGLAQAVSEGRRREFSSFGWRTDDVPDPQAAETCRRSCLNWSEIEAEPHVSMRSWYRGLIALRHRMPALHAGSRERVACCSDDDAGWFCMERGPVFVFCNLSPSPRRIPLPDARIETLLLASEPEAALTPDAIALPPESAAITCREDATPHPAPLPQKERESTPSPPGGEGWGEGGNK